MDSEPDPLPDSYLPVEVSSQAQTQFDLIGPQDQSDPFSLRGLSVAFIGVLIAFASIGIPIAAIWIEKPSIRHRIVPIALESDEPKPSLFFSLTGIGKPSSRDTSRQ